MSMYVWKCVVFEFDRKNTFNNKDLNFVVSYLQLTQHICSMHS